MSCRHLFNKKIEINRSLNWKEINKIKIEENFERLIPASYLPEKIIVDSFYFKIGIKGAIPEVYVRETIMKKLIKAADLLPKGYKLLVYDGWRPYQVQKKLHDLLLKKYKDKLTNRELKEFINKYVAPPSKDEKSPSPHLTGGAVDLTIINDKGIVLDMGTKFDHLGPKSNTFYYEDKLNLGLKLSQNEKKILENRRLLFNIMTNQGFTNFPEEWWHYDYGNQNWIYFSGEDEKPAFYGKSIPDLPWQIKY